MKIYIYSPFTYGIYFKLKGIYRRKWNNFWKLQVKCNGSWEFLFAYCCWHKLTFYPSYCQIPLPHFTVLWLLSVRITQPQCQGRADPLIWRQSACGMQISNCWALVADRDSFPASLLWGHELETQHNAASKSDQPEMQKEIWMCKIPVSRAPSLTPTTAWWLSAFKLAGVMPSKYCSWEQRI